jgi:arylsulfatase A-like enzyme
VILTSDLGENFGEHGLIEHQLCLYDTLLRVPLVLRYPALLKPERTEKRVSTISLFNTVKTLVAAAAGVGSENSGLDPLSQIQGQDSLFAECSNGVDMLKGAVGAEGAGVDFSKFDRSLKCVVKGDYKLIWSSNGEHELYRMDKDPHEADNVIEKEQDQARALDQLLKSWELSTPSKNVF